MVSLPFEPVMVVSLVGLAGGLGMLVRGLGSFRTSGRISDTAGSRISSLAAGEARITGVVEAAELLLVSPLQSANCVYYRASVEERNDDRDSNVFREERAVGFRLRDETGTIRIFPRGARWAIQDRLNDRTAMMGEQPASLDIRVGPAVTAGTPDRDAAVERLLTVRDTRAWDPQLSALLGSGHRTYREARIEPGDVITIVGFVEPFEILPDPTGADDASFGDGAPGDPFADPTIAADLAEARASGQLAGSPEEAWGNAGIPGFGIGLPVRAPHLDPGATAPPIAEPATADRYERTFHIAPEELVVAATPDVSLLVTLGGPAEAAAIQDSRFMLGLVGAVIAIVSAMTLALLISGALAL